MSRLFYHVMQDNAGNLLFDVSGTMRLAGTGTAATIYGDEALTVPIANPMTNHPSFGSFKCYLGASASGYDFYMAKAGYTFETLTGVQGLGTMAQQDASAVAISGGTGAFTTLSATNLTVPDAPVGPAYAVGLNVSYGVSRYNLNITGNAGNYLAGQVGIQVQPVTATALGIHFDKSYQDGIALRATGTDTPGSGNISFYNVAAGVVGRITTDATTTTYGTTSDARLKHAIAPLTGALGVVQALKPVHFLWNANDEPGQGFLAHELMRHVPAAVTGEPDAVGPQGEIVPQQVDHSRIVPWLTAALQETLARVVVLEAHVSALQAQIEP